MISAVLREALIGGAAFVGYYVAMVTLLFLARRLIGISGELYRKLFHIGVAGSVFVLLHAFTLWHVSTATAVVFGFLVYFVIGWAERFPRAMRALEEREPGEIRSSLALMFLTIAVLIALGWGWLGDEYKFTVVVSIMAWGFGDASAALIGKRWGKQRLTHEWVDGKKTVEGTLAMLAFAAAAILVTLVAYTAWPWYLCVVVALLVAPAAAGTELVSHQGVDTVTVPLATFAWFLVVVAALSALGLI